MSVRAKVAGKLLGSVAPITLAAAKLRNQPEHEIVSYSILSTLLALPRRTLLSLSLSISPI